MTPYSGGRSRTTTGHKFAWARLNADTFLLVLLCFYAGMRALLDPFSEPTIAELGFPTPSFYLRTICYLVSGLIILYALIRQSVAVEVMGRTILVFAVCFELFRRVSLLGWGDPDSIAQTFLVVIILLVTGLRLSVLLSKKGLVVNLPQRNDPGPGRRPTS